MKKMFRPPVEMIQDPDRPDLVRPKGHPADYPISKKDVIYADEMETLYGPGYTNHYIFKGVSSTPDEKDEWSEWIDSFPTSHFRDYEKRAFQDWLRKMPRGKPFPAKPIERKGWCIW